MTSIETVPTVMGRSWLGQEVSMFKCRLGDLNARLPVFERGPFGEGANENRYLRTIVRQPLGEDKRLIPVATVSNRYALVQHREVCQWLSAGLESLGFRPDDLEVEVVMSEYGERFRIAVRLVRFDFDPGDGDRLGALIEIINSVDRSCALEVRLRWRRLVCLNGLWIDEKDTLRKIHNVDWMSHRSVATFIGERTADMAGFKQTLARWLATPLDLATIDGWAAELLAERWGVQLAARCLHIVRTGWDGTVERSNGKARLADIRVRSETQVPGAHAPVGNLYHLSQVLTWLARDRGTVDEADEMALSIPRLLRNLEA